MECPIRCEALIISFEGGGFLWLEKGKNFVPPGR
jgi:hypothetical protein